MVKKRAAPQNGIVGVGEIPGRGSWQGARMACIQSKMQSTKNFSVWWRPVESWSEKAAICCVITKEGSKDMWQYPEYLNPEGEHLHLGKGMRG